MVVWDFFHQQYDCIIINCYDCILKLSFAFSKRHTINHPFFLSSKFEPCHLAKWEKVIFTRSFSSLTFGIHFENGDFLGVIYWTKSWCWNPNMSNSKCQSARLQRFQYQSQSQWMKVRCKFDHNRWLKLVWRKTKQHLGKLQHTPVAPDNSPIARYERKPFLSLVW